MSDAAVDPARAFTKVDAARRSGPRAVLEILAESLKAAGAYHELFEARKMQLRERLGLPLSGGSEADALDETGRTKLEEGLLAACREVGLLFLAGGQVREGWMYFRPVGDRAAAAAELAKITPTEENQEALLEVCLYEGVDIGRGFQMLLDQNGTCNSITTYDGLMAQRTAAEQKQAALPLLRHVYNELRESLRTDISRQQGKPATEETIAALIADRDWLTADGAYHIDTTHLSSTVRIARVLDDAVSHRQAVELCQYGRRLSPQLQYAGSEPFAETYPAHQLFYQALLGENAAAAVDYFRGKAETLDQREHGPVGIEVYLELLSRMDRPADALREAIRLLPAGRTGLPGCPSLLELARRSGLNAELQAFARTRGDLLTFGLAAAEAK